MVFSSTEFLFLFFPLVLIGYYNPFFSGRKFKNIFLFLASLVFYAWGEPVFVFLMMISIIAGWFAGLKIESALYSCQKRRILILGVTLHLGILFLFKYLTFIVKEFGWIFNNDSIAFNIILPIGISFFTFQLLSYLFDIYYGKVHAQRNILNVGLYIALFPQLIAGPIVRYETIEKQILDRMESLSNVCEGMMRFIFGLGKKVLIANCVGQIADTVFDCQGEMSIMTAWLGAIAYTFQIYFDFSGYSDMAIGLGRMFGFRFLENFNYPYMAESVTDFWRRWHISLGTWFRDYVYIPLGGNHVSKLRWIVNILVVWFLTGLWHGANWTFICWGLFYFVLLLSEKLTGFVEKFGKVSHLYALVAIIIGWTIFRSPDLNSAVNYIGCMFGICAAGLVDDLAWQYLSGGYIVLILATVFSLPVGKYVRRYAIYEYAEPVIALGIFALSLVKIISSTYNPFIYFNF